MIPGTFGQKSPALSMKLSPNGCSAKTSRATSIWDLPTSPEILQPWATAQRRACSQRLKLARATGVTASSFWPTPTAADAGYCPDILIRQGTLTLAKPALITSSSGGQYPIKNASRMWTAVWLLLQAFGWKPGTSRSSPPVLLSFARGKTFWLRGLISNPRFYEGLMGWPIGWTAPEGQVTGFAAWLRQSRGLFSRLISSATGHSDEVAVTANADRPTD